MVYHNIKYPNTVANNAAVASCDSFEDRCDFAAPPVTGRSFESPAVISTRTSLKFSLLPLGNEVASLVLVTVE